MKRLYVYSYKDLAARLIEGNYYLFSDKVNHHYKSSDEEKMKGKSWILKIEKFNVDLKILYSVLQVTILSLNDFDGNIMQSEKYKKGQSRKETLLLKQIYYDSFVIYELTDEEVVSYVTPYLL